MKVRALLEPSFDLKTQYHWRVFTPFKYLRINGYDADVVIPGYDTLDIDTDIFIIPKLTGNEKNRNTALTLINYYKNLGIKFVYDSDDDIWSSAYVQYGVQFQDEPDSKMLNIKLSVLERQVEQNKWFLNLMDAVIVSTPPLAEVVKQYTELPVHVINNAIDVDFYKYNLNVDAEVRHPHYKTIGWAGGSRPLRCLRPMLDAWDFIATVYDDVKFVFAGWTPDLSLFPNLTKDKIIEIEWQPIEHYLDSMQVDIGCVNVDNDQFSLCKTRIKAWEFALADAMIIGSDALYGAEPTMINCDTVDDWIGSIIYYLKYDEERKNTAAFQKQNIIQLYDAKVRWVDWANTYEAILNESKTVEV